MQGGPLPACPHTRLPAHTPACLPTTAHLPPHHQIGYFTDASKELWSNLIDLQPRTGGAGGGLSREDYIAGVVKDIAAKVPEPGEEGGRGGADLCRPTHRPPTHTRAHSPPPPQRTS